ncbi:hypothetical protein AMJ47_00795 [Parcubacteria bacterium DG_72]|nr:MAG: hypothetical protein AMJ47_00795 [Parcubacteria bacterium DG_72]
MQKSNFNIVIAGVGGQGVITLTQIIAEAALLEGKDVRASELHGLSQRGGSVETHLRMGKKVYSPLVVAADLILSLEITEGLRKMQYASAKTTFLINRHSISYQAGLSEKEISKKINLIKEKKYLVPASKICQKQLGKEVLSGVYLLSFAVHKGLIPLKPESVLKTIENMPEKYIDINKKAFSLAKDFKA